jgi:hypothetical protein
MDSPTLIRDPLTRLHIIAHLDWQRDGLQPFELQRAELLDILAHLTLYMQPQAGDAPLLKHFLLGGQTVILEDISAVRPNLVALLAIYNAGGRLSVGPWYTQSDTMLVSGESLVRNLLIGRADVKRHGMRPLNVAYMPNACHQTAHLPQILRSFGIDAAFFCMGRPIMPLPFRWEAPDGSDLLVMNYREVGDPQASVASQRDGQPDGPFLWMYPCRDHEEIVLRMAEEALDIPVLQSNFAEYLRALRQELPDPLRPALYGEAQLQDETHQPTGRFSARLPIKQWNEALQTRLAYFTERWLALGLTHGNYPQPENGQALLEYTWRRLLVNQSAALLSGAVTDTVYAEMQGRFRAVDDLSRRLSVAALNALSGLPLHDDMLPFTDTETLIVVWNPHGNRVQQVVTTVLRLPKNTHPQRLLNPEGTEIPFTWANQRLYFRADVGTVGYAVYTVRLSSQPTPHQYLPRVVHGSVIGSINGEVLAVQNGQINWRSGNQQFNDVLNFYNGGDAGDVRNYRAPFPDIVLRAGMSDVVEIEASALYEQLVLKHRLRLPPGLQDGKRERGIRLLELVTTATCYADTPGIFFKTTFSNTAGDHRLRAHFRSGLRATQVYADAAYGMLKREMRPNGDSGVMVMQGMAAVTSEEGLFAVLTRGLTEFEPLRGDGQTTLAVTLLRAVSWLDQTRRLQAAGAQHQEEFTAEYALLALPTPETTRLLPQVAQYRAPLQAVQYAEAPREATRSYLTLSEERLQLTALKPPQDGQGWIVRLYNPLSTPVTTVLGVYGTLKKALRTSMAEVPNAEYEISANSIKVELNAQQIVTIWLQFESES